MMCTRTTELTDGYSPLVAENGREVVVELEARPADWDVGNGRAPLAGWTYNGMVPGPTIEANVGEMLVVRLTNRLDEPTTIDWHGLRLPPVMDGTEDVQRPVAPGETFEYRFALPDAGTFWYHPHANETVQLERGLYGVLVVRERAELVTDKERVLVFDDVKLDRRGRIARPGGIFEKHNGREGNVLLLNGRERPELEVAAGQTERWRIVNVASARYVRLAVGALPFRIIGSDGGLMEQPVTASEVVLAPADRVELLVGPFVDGQRLNILSLPHNRGLGARKLPDVYGAVRVVAGRDSVAHVPARLRTIEPPA